MTMPKDSEVTKEGDKIKDTEKVKNFLDDIKYESSFIKKELVNFESKLKELLVVKHSTPSVLNPEPTFSDPKFLEN